MSQLVHNGKSIPKFPKLTPGITALHLNNCTINGKKLSEIPKSIGAFNTIQKLDIGNNEIKELPEELFELTNLKLLHFYKNKIVKVPKEIGNLVNLEDLNIHGNDIEYLPLEIANLTKLKSFTVNDTKLPLPSNYSANSPANTISYILENQEVPLESPRTRKAYIFKNIQKDNIKSKFDEILNNYIEEIGTNLIEVNSLKDINKSKSIVFFLITFDSHKDSKLLFKLLEKCSKLDLNYYILLQNKIIETSINFINRSIGSVTEQNEELIRKNYKDKTLLFGSYDELKGNIFSALDQHSPKVRLSKISLINIGHFKNLELDFDENINCLVGENGAGKSTILRSIGLAILGGVHPSIERKKMWPLLRISGLNKEGQTIYESGSIELSYSIDGDDYTNKISLEPIDKGRDFKITSENESEILTGGFNLKCPIVGFPQLRSEVVQSSSESFVKMSQPHVNDLIPLIYSNEEDNRLNSFISWIVNLDVKGLQEVDSNENEEITVTENKNRAIIDKVFGIISEITRHEIKYIKVKSASPPDVWVSTFDSPDGIPLSMVSQGFKIIMSWVGYYLERLINSFPTLLTNQAIVQNSILILDEIDTSIHPKWQAQFISILRKNFIKTQFIFTTHSPLIISRLNKEQILNLEINDSNEIVLSENDIDTWSLNYNDILHKLFNTTESPPLYNLEQLKEQLENTPAEDEETIKLIKENINSLSESASLSDSLEDYEKALKEKQSELEELIKKVKS